MRRLFVLVAGVVLVHTAAGCKCIQGVCDCAPPIQPCCMYGLYPSGPPMPPVPPGAGQAMQGVPVEGLPPAGVPVAPPVGVPVAPPAGVPMPPPAGQPPVKEPVMKEKIGLPKEL